MTIEETTPKSDGYVAAAKYGVYKIFLCSRGYQQAADNTCTAITRMIVTVLTMYKMLAVR